MKTASVLLIALAALHASLVAAFVPRGAAVPGRTAALRTFESKVEGGPDMTPIDEARRRIAEALSPTELDVSSTHDDPNGSHITIRVVSSEFEGKNRVQRQRLVYKAIFDLMEPGPIHAVDALVCEAPSDA